MNGKFDTEISLAGILAMLTLFMLASLQVEHVFSQSGGTSGNNTNSVNQTQSTVLANLTVADFQPVISSLSEAREGLLTNNTLAAYGALNTAGSELFRIERSDASEALSKQLRPVMNQIENAHEAVQNHNGSQALRHIYFTDINLLKIIENLPAGEDVNEETDEAG